ncbi:CBS domain-containing protein [Acetobacter sp. TBRC 12305]|uniref:CBS domain-containing protein n=1 Tax=Acetobacter garciniae TaxID=2817435 RepID=A0A939HJT2_9PROT|nr:CBS domain-containing protein [Acetobacter garciniae]MBO1325730.1 CBS domain-containing protein [Acetobacter garciniae]MBX0345630.1 CBS domain-containing protein [Acetobacter garciniae]
MSSRVFHILAQKGRMVITVREDDLVTTLADILVHNNIGGAPVVDAQGKLVGLVSEKTIVRAVSEHGAGLSTLFVKDIMSTDVPTATPDDSLYDVACRMTTFRARHMPVLEDGKLVGLVSIGDVVKLRAATAEEEARELQAYVTGNGHAAVLPHEDVPSIQCESGSAPLQNFGV